VNSAYSSFPAETGALASRGLDLNVLEYLPQPAAIAEANGHILWANDLFTNLLNLSPDQKINGKEILTHLAPPDQRQHLHERWQAALAGKRSVSWEGPLLSAMGKLHRMRWNMSGVPGSEDGQRLVLMLGWDETSEVQGQAVTRCAEQGLDLVSEVVVVVDALGEIVYANAAAARQAGVPAKDLVGKKAVAFMEIPEDMKEVHQALHTLQAGQPWRGEIRLAVVDSGFQAYEAAVIPWRSADSPGRLFLIAAQRASALESNALAATEKRQLDSLTHLANGMAHRFNNILAGVLGQAEILLMTGDQLPEAAQKRAEKITHAAIQGRDLIAKLTAYTRKQEKKARPLDVAPVIRNACTKLRKMCPPDVTMDMQLPARLRPAKVVSEELHESILQLGYNALTAMEHGGGHLTVSVEEDSAIFPDLPGVHGEDVNTPCLVLRVKDTGSGIAPSVCESMFDPFYTTKNMAESPGMGLPIVRGMIDRQHGRIEYDTEEGKGTEFRLYLPALEDSELREESKPRSKAGEKILLVDEDPHVTETGAAQLNELGYQVVAINNGEQAAEMLAAEAGLFDLIVASLSAADLLKSTGSTPVLITCGREEVADKPSTTAQYLYKPCSVDDLARAVKQAIHA